MRAVRCRIEKTITLQRVSRGSVQIVGFDAQNPEAERYDHTQFVGRFHLQLPYQISRQGKKNEFGRNIQCCNQDPTCILQCVESVTRLSGVVRHIPEGCSAERKTLLMGSQHCL